MQFCNRGAEYAVVCQTQISCSVVFISQLKLTFYNPKIFTIII